MSGCIAAVADKENLHKGIHNFNPSWEVFQGNPSEVYVTCNRAALEHYRLQVERRQDR